MLLHGFSTSAAASWARGGWIDLLAGEGFRVLAPDCRSHGSSDRIHDASECSTPTLAADVAALLDHLELSRASLFGFSMGGGVALQFAADFRDRVDRVVVGGVGDAAINALHDPAEVAAIASAFEDGGGSTRIRRVAEAAGNDLHALVPFLRGGGWPGGLAELCPPAAPLLLIVAEHDQYMRATGELRRRLPQAEVLDVSGRDHHDVLDDDAVRSRVLAFLRSPAAH